jgi:hypothetical protein
MLDTGDSDTGCRRLDTGCWMRGAGCRRQEAGYGWQRYRMQEAGYRILQAENG